MSELPPLSVEDFHDRVLQARHADQQAQQDQSILCRACKKIFKTKNSYDNHLNSKKHKESLKVFKESHHGNNDVDQDVCVFESNIIDEKKDLMEIESVDSDEWNDFDIENPIDNNDCIFCENHSKNLTKNLKHMSIAHSFFIPDAEYCCDIKGLLAYLAEKVCKDFMCLWCNEKGKTFYSIQSVRQHMIEKGHTKMLHEGITLAEYADFYDYSSSYPDHTESDIDIDAEIETPFLDGDEYQLVLPSGIVIGHRSLLRYYKQHLRTNNTPVNKQSGNKMHKVLSHYRNLGWNVSKQEEIAKKARDIHVMKRTQAKLYAKLGCKANKLQKHYRPQVNF